MYLGHVSACRTSLRPSSGQQWEVCPFLESLFLERNSTQLCYLPNVLQCISISLSFPPQFLQKKKHKNLETTEQTVDQTYQVLKQAGEISSSKAIDTMKTTTTANINDVSGGGGNNGATTAMMPPMNLAMKDIPVVNVPDYPDRVVAPRRQPLKPSSINQGPNLQPIKQGLTAPPQDVSSSGPTLTLSKTFQILQFRCITI